MVRLIQTGTTHCRREELRCCKEREPVPIRNRFFCVQKSKHFILCAFKSLEKRSLPAVSLP